MHQLNLFNFINSNNLKGTTIKTFKYIDLFCGAGGFSLGFDKSGFQNVFSVDIEEDFCKTYKTNFPTHTLIQKNISQITKEEIIKLTDSHEVDVIIGGPPCQGFSIAGNIGRKFIDDPRNKLFKEFVRVVSIVNPKYFVQYLYFPSMVILNIYLKINLTSSKVVGFSIITAINNTINPTVIFLSN
jgi:predicted RNA methylase